MFFNWICLDKSIEDWETLLYIHAHLISDRKSSNYLDLLSRLGCINIVTSHNHFLCTRNTTRFDLRGRLLNDKSLEISIDWFVFFHDERARWLTSSATSQLYRLSLMQIIRSFGFSTSIAFVDCFFQLIEYLWSNSNNSFNFDQLPYIFHLQVRYSINEGQIKKFDVNFRHNIFKTRWHLTKLGIKHSI